MHTIVEKKTKILVIKCHSTDIKHIFIKYVCLMNVSNYTIKNILNEPRCFEINSS